MHHDVADLRDFYAGPLGLVARRLLAQRIRRHWPEAKGLTMVGLGFCTPYLGSYRGEALRLGAFMPAAQGALAWPSSALNGRDTRDQTGSVGGNGGANGGGVLAVMVDEDHLPLADNAVDRFLAMHILEVADRPGPLLREIWRVLSPEGRLLLVVPNRRSIWARVDTTPFGHGRPYSRRQLERLLNDALFEPIDWSNALFVPPVQQRPVLQSANAIERIGLKVSPGFGGVIIVEARKSVANIIPATGKLVKARGLAMADG